MTTNDPKREPGYRGSLPTQNDRLARPWVLIVFVIFVAIFVLAALGVPSRFAPEPTPLPIPSIPVPSGSVDASGSPDASGSESPAASESASPSPEP